ncbi:MAG: hypothetical protein OXH65_02835 [Paracoccaceae bacterium]|nr:hypothetical protein [Paracoccaceae bacterium]
MKFSFRFIVRKRPGFSLLEAALSLILIGLSMNQVLSLVDGHIMQKQVQAEARMVSAVADDHVRTIAGNLIPALATARVSGPATVAFTPADHIGSETPFGREIRIAHFAPSTTQLLVMVYTWSPYRVIGGQVRPLYEPGISLTGYLAGSNDRCNENHICGMAMDWDARTLVNALGSQAPGNFDLVTLRWLTIESHVRSYLHRSAMTGHPELNRMATDLNLGNNDLDGVGRLEANDVVVDEGFTLTTELNSQTPGIGGDLTVGGNLASSGDLIAGKMEIGSDATITTADIRGKLTMATADITGDVSMSSLDIANSLELGTGASLDVDGPVNTNDITLDELDVIGDMTGAVLDYEGIAVSLDTVRAGTVIINELEILNQCTNC